MRISDWSSDVCSSDLVGRMLQMHSNHREAIKDARAGEIVAIAGLKDTTTGETLCDAQHPIILERMEFPEPVIEVAVEPKTHTAPEQTGVPLNRLAAQIGRAACRETE